MIQGRGVFDLIRNNNLLDIETHIKNGHITDHTGEWSQTPLTYAIISGRIEMVKLFLTNGFNANLKTTDGSTPLHVCLDTWDGNIYSYECVLMLIEHGAIVDIKDNYNKLTPLGHIAHRTCIHEKQIANLLMQYGATLANIPDTIGIPHWLKEMEIGFKRRVGECRKALLTILYVCTRGAFRPTGEILLCAARQVWCMKGGEGCGPRAGGASGAQGWDLLTNF